MTLAKVISRIPPVWPFGKISPLWQNVKNIWQLFEHLKILNLLWYLQCAFVPIYIVVYGQILTNIQGIWSHWIPPWQPKSIVWSRISEDGAGTLFKHSLLDQSWRHQHWQLDLQASLQNVSNCKWHKMTIKTFLKVQLLSGCKSFYLRPLILFVLNNYWRNWIFRFVAIGKSESKLLKR